MYCPNCANSIDGVQKFCRACGANVSLVPQAMTGQLPVVVAEDDEFTSSGKRKRKKVPTIEKSVRNIFSGLGFLVAALFVTFWFPGGFTWGWSFLFPAFALIGEGIGQFLKVKELERQRHPAFYQPPVPANFPPPVPPPPGVEVLSAPTTSELASPVSVTEQTTRHLERG
jgi:hypothetical protein